MFDLGPHAAFIWMSYGVVFISLLAIVIWLVRDGRKQQSLIDEFEARGVMRRSAPGRD